jgi:hypothetical protein
MSQDDLKVKLGSNEDLQGLVLHITREDSITLDSNYYIKDDSDKGQALEREQKEVISD